MSVLASRGIEGGRLRCGLAARLGLWRSVPAAGQGVRGAEWRLERVAVRADLTVLPVRAGRAWLAARGRAAGCPRGRRRSGPRTCGPPHRGSARRSPLDSCWSDARRAPWRVWWAAVSMRPGPAGPPLVTIAVSTAVSTAATRPGSGWFRPGPVVGRRRAARAGAGQVVRRTPSDGVELCLPTRGGAAR